MRLHQALPVVAALGATAVYAWQQNAGNRLPPPFATPSANNPSRTIPPPAGARVKVPAGFQVSDFATGFDEPRFMVLGQAGEVLLSDSSAGVVYLLNDRDKNGQAEDKKQLIKGLKRPYGLAFWKEYLYVADEEAVRRYPYDSKNQSAGKAQELINLRDVQGGHWTRSITFDPKGEKLYLGVGSRSNVDAGEPEMRAAIHRYNPDGSGREPVAAGTRNPIGLHFHPTTGALWAAVQERDLLGDDLVPDYFTQIKQGGFYGWPYAYSGPNEDPRRKSEKPDLVKQTLPPDVLLGAHVAVLDFTFYTGKQFPAEYQGGAFLAFHGSWNRSQRVGYSLAFVPFQNGRPSADKPREFLTGFLLDPNKKEVWGRPVGVLQMPDGSLLFSDDGGQKVWRITYKQ